jgi:4-amino-4-deoxy-L-arabinose transferase-like glycosyltransferase
LAKAFQDKTYFILACWIVFFCTGTAFWIFNDKLPPAWDQANYLEASEILLRSLKEKGLADFFSNFLEILPRKAPLISALPIPFYTIFGSGEDYALIVNLVFFIFGSVFFYLLVSNFYSKKIALGSVVVLSSMPLFYGLARNFYVEFGLAALVIIWFYLLIKSEFLSNVKYLVLLGIFGGLGVLMKFHFPIFVIGPFLIYLYNLYKKCGRRSFLNLFWIVLPAIIIAGPWYFQNIDTVLWHAKRATSAEILGNYYWGNPFLPAVIARSLLAFVNFAVSGYYFLIFAVLAGFHFVNRKRFVFNYFFASWFLIPFLIFFFGPNKDYRLMLPVLPPLAVLLSSLFFSVLGKERFVKFGLAIIVPVIIFLNSTFEKELIDGSVFIGPILISDDTIGAYVRRPISEEWPNVEILKLMSNIGAVGKTVFLGSEHEFFNINNMRYYNAKENIGLKLKSALYFSKSTPISEVIANLNTGDFLLIKAGGHPGPSDIYPHPEEIISGLDNKLWRQVSNNFVFPNGGKLLIYQKEHD